MPTDDVRCPQSAIEAPKAISAHPGGYHSPSSPPWTGPAPHLLAHGVPLLGTKPGARSIRLHHATPGRRFHQRRPSRLQLAAPLHHHLLSACDSSNTSCLCSPEVARRGAERERAKPEMSFKHQARLAAATRRRQRQAQTLKPHAHCQHFFSAVSSGQSLRLPLPSRGGVTRWRCVRSAERGPCVPAWQGNSSDCLPQSRGVERWLGFVTLGFEVSYWPGIGWYVGTPDRST
ncbi:hypothetical protein IWZ00DRAFT_13175 [Phyllosticta capitalensis]